MFLCARFSTRLRLLTRASLNKSLMKPVFQKGPRAVISDRIVFNSRWSMSTGNSESVNSAAKVNKLYILLENLNQSYLKKVLKKKKKKDLKKNKPAAYTYSKINFGFSQFLGKVVNIFARDPRVIITSEAKDFGLNRMKNK